MIVAVTGGSGFTGQFVVERLVAAGHRVRCLARPTTDRSLLPPGAAAVEGDLGDPASLQRLLRGADALVSVASLGLGHAPNLVEACEAESVQRAVFFSTTSIFTKLETPSRAVRVGAERRIRDSRLAWTILRPTMIYGTERDRNMSRVIRFLNLTPLVPLPGGGSALIQPVYVQDLAEAVLRVLAESSTAGHAYDLPGSGAAPLKDVVRFVSSRLGRRAAVVALPIGPMAAAAAVWSRTGALPRISREQILRLAEDKAFPSEEARRDFSYAPRSWREGLALEIDRLRQVGWVR